MNAESILATLIDVWWKAIHTEYPADDAACWQGFIAGTSVAIAVASGIPDEGIDVFDAAAAGAAIAQARGAP